MFATIDEVIQRFAKLQYITGRTIATVVYLAAEMKKPILVEGPAGVGKTELAKVLAGALGQEFIRLQCYEGLDEAKALYEWEYAKQLLYTQLLKDKIGEMVAGTGSLSEAADRLASGDAVFFSERFLLPRPILQALLSPRPAVLPGWATGLGLLHAEALTADLVGSTLNLGLKYEGDIEKAKAHLSQIAQA